MSGIDVRGLSVKLFTGQSIVRDVDFTIAAGEVVALVGESGSGKTTVATAMLGYTRGGSRVSSGVVDIDAVNVLALDRLRLVQARGTLVSYVPQDPGTALNPARRVGWQLDQTVRAHSSGEDRDERLAKIRAALVEVGLPQDDNFLRLFPHQISGGQQQRILIAMAFIGRPKLIVLDEPTTGLDVTTQRMVLDVIRAMCRSHQVSALYVSHDLAAVREIADRVMVMYAGQIVETATCAQLFESPKHPYTLGLLNAIPDVKARRAIHAIPGTSPSVFATPATGCSFSPRCPEAADECGGLPIPLTEIAEGRGVRCCRVVEAGAPRASIAGVAPRAAFDPSAHVLLRLEGVNVSYGGNRVVHDVDLRLREEETLAIVGESGSGKTTLVRAIAGIARDWEGAITFDTRQLATRARARPDEVRRAIQYIFQNPYMSLNPRMTVGDSLTAAVRHFFAVGGVDAADRVRRALEDVNLTAATTQRYPRELSGGERQRVAIARALVCEPRILVCDEVTSALDVSVQASILALLERLRAEQKLSLLFVTHNLAVVREVADRVAVMQAGRIVEMGEVGDILDRPHHQYTRELLASCPSLELAELAVEP